MILEKLSSKELAMAAHTCKDFAGRMRQLRSHIRQLHITTGVHSLQLLLGWAAAGLWCTAGKPQNYAVKPSAPGMVILALPKHGTGVQGTPVLPVERSPPPSPPSLVGCWLRWDAATSDKLPQLLCQIPLDWPFLCCSLTPCAASASWRQQACRASLPSQNWFLSRCSNEAPNGFWEGGSACQRPRSDC